MTTDEMKNFDTGAVRDTGGKGRMDLLPMCALLRVSKHMEDALTHYPERNWEKGLPMHTMIDSALRHLVKYADGMTDEDHLCAATTNLLMAMWTEEKKPEMQDLPSRESSGPCHSLAVIDGIKRCMRTPMMKECDCNGYEARCSHCSEIYNGEQG